MARYDRVGEQILDSAGDPLANGKLYFYNSGTTTEKTTYKDINLSIPNTNPVLLDGDGRVPAIFFTGTARVVLTDNDEVQIESKDPVGGEAEEGVYSPWNSLTIYNKGDIVEGSNGLFYISITDGNQDNDPTTDVVNWTQFILLKKWNANETYVVGDAVQGSDNKIYISLQSANLNQDPTTETSFWGASSVSDLDDIVAASAYSYAYDNFG